jgi:hypothetical protein
VRDAHLGGGHDLRGRSPAGSVQAGRLAAVPVGARRGAAGGARGHLRAGAEGAPGLLQAVARVPDGARLLPVNDRAHAALNAAFERALAAGMSRMPRVWHMYASVLLD